MRINNVETDRAQMTIWRECSTVYFNFLTGMDL